MELCSYIADIVVVQKLRYQLGLSRYRKSTEEPFCVVQYLLVSRVVRLFAAVGSHYG